jgi:hypothetical protein
MFGQVFGSRYDPFGVFGLSANFEVNHNVCYHRLPAGLDEVEWMTGVGFGRGRAQIRAEIWWVVGREDVKIERGSLKLSGCGSQAAGENGVGSNKKTTRIQIIEYLTPWEPFPGKDVGREEA